jgi:glucose-1-phosphate cytidylyltransferase
MTKVVLLAGGKGSRLNGLLPKPLVKIGEIPLIQHIMNSYNFFGYNEFILATGHQHIEFEKYFYNIDLPYSVKLVDTGEDTNTGERIRKIKPYVKDEVFCLSYGDGLSDVNLEEVESSFHFNDFVPDLLLTTVHPPERYGLISLEDNDNKTSIVKSFDEKPKRTDWINGGFMVCNPNIFDYIDKDDVFEQHSVPRIVKNKKLIAYKHHGNWGSVDTQKDLNTLIDLWDNNKAFWTNLRRN